MVAQKHQNFCAMWNNNNTTTLTQWKGQVLSAEVLRAFGSVTPGGRSSPCHLRRSASAIWLEETHWTPKNHLAQNDRWGHPAYDFGVHTAWRKAGQGGLASSRQYGNALLGVRHQEEEHSATLWNVKTWHIHALLIFRWSDTCWQSIEYEGMIFSVLFGIGRYFAGALKRDCRSIQNRADEGVSYVSGRLGYEPTSCSTCSLLSVRLCIW